VSHPYKTAGKIMIPCKTLTNFTEERKINDFEENSSKHFSKFNQS
jgi:hypothetical protein